LNFLMANSFLSAVRAESLPLRVYDPNYQTLAGIDADIFGEDKKRDFGGFAAKGGPIQPYRGAAGIAGYLANNGLYSSTSFILSKLKPFPDTYDPNYQTLAGLPDVFGADKKQTDGFIAGRGAFDDKGPTVPMQRGAQADMYDPNYQVSVFKNCFEFPTYMLFCKNFGYLHWIIFVGIREDIFGTDKKRW
uniref:HEME_HALOPEROXIDASE domain-containing protein n=1 Tax=Dracunculus medinensis TaxID=318479 RepID=A0A0N4U659_DRAME